VGAGFLILNSCCSSTQVSTGQVDFYSQGTRSAISKLELQIGETSILDMRTGGGFYGASCLVQSENPKVVAAKRNSSERLVLEGLVEGETRVTVQCNGMAGGEQAVCDARFENTGSVMVKVVQAVNKSSD
jgi:hypothetical protein